MKVVRHGDTAIANYRFVVTINGPNTRARHRYRVTNIWMSGTAAARSSPGTPRLFWTQSRRRCSPQEGNSAPVSWKAAIGMGMTGFAAVCRLKEFDTHIASKEIQR
jgi:hypothetical protein